MCTWQNGVEFIEVVSFRSKFPDANAVMMTLVDIPPLLEKKLLGEELDLRSASPGSRFLSKNNELEFRRPSCGGELLLTFFTCFLWVLLLLQLQRSFVGTVFIDSLCCGHILAGPEAFLLLVPSLLKRRAGAQFANVGESSGLTRELLAQIGPAGFFCRTLIYSSAPSSTTLV